MEKHEQKTGDKDDGLIHVTSRFPVAYELELHRVIELAAYLRAEKDGFRCSPLDYWLAAERDVHRCF